ncbi:microtubule-binding stalk of dynein motor-domain-containing protein, partial [Baffinella frigidus]
MADLDQRASRMEEEKGEWQVEIGKQDRVVQQLLQDVGLRTTELEAMHNMLKKQEANAVADVGRRTTELEAMRNMLKKQEANAVAILAKLRATRRKLADSVDEVTPKLQSATELLKAMNKGELSEIKSFSLPPVHLEKVFSTVLILMANNYSSQLDVSWSRVRQTISAVDRFVIKLLQFDPETIEKAERPLKSKTPIVDLVPQEILLPDPLLAPEVRWMRAILAYHTAFLEDISPLTQEVKEQEKEVDEANKLVAATKVGLGEAEEAIRELTTLFEQATHEKSTMVSSRDQSASLHQRALELSNFLSAQTSASLRQRALELSNFLSAQTVEWVRARNDLTQALITLPGDALVAAALITLPGDALVAAVLLSLGGPLSVRFRAQLLEGHLKTALNNSDVPSSGKARRMLDVLLPVHEACVEYMRGLTHPRLSLTCSFADYNCAVAMNAPRAALLVDPDAQVLCSELFELRLPRHAS